MAADLNEEQMKNISRILLEQNDSMLRLEKNTKGYSAALLSVENVHKSLLVDIEKLSKKSKKNNADGIKNEKAKTTLEDILFGKVVKLKKAYERLETTKNTLTDEVSIKKQLAQGKKLVDIYKEKNNEIRLSVNYARKQAGFSIKESNLAKKAGQDTLKDTLLHSAGIKKEKYEEYARDPKVATGRTQISAAKGLGTILSGKTSGMGGTFEAFKGIKKQFTDLKDVASVAEVNGIKPIAGGIMSLTSVFKALNAAMKGNIFLLILTAIVELGKALLKLDKILKDNNKRFTEVAGSIINIKKGDLDAKMVEYGRAIHDLSINMRYGIDSLQAGEVFAGFKAGGMALGGVTSRIGDYKKVLEDTVVLSYNLGTSFQEMGGMISENMVEMRAGFGEVSDALNRMGYDAAITGIDTNKFYQSIESATSSLRIYGNYLDYASGMLRDYVKTGSMGFKEASAQVNNLMSNLGNLAMEGRMKLVGMMGGVTASSELYIKAAGRVQKEIDAVNEKMKGATTDDERMKLATDLVNLQDKQNDLLKISTGSYMEQAFNVGKLAGNVKDMIFDVLKTTQIDLFNPEHAAALESVFTNIGLSAETARNEMLQARDIIGGFTDSFVTLGSTVDSLFGGPRKDAIRKWQKQYEEGSLTEADYWEKLKKEIIATGKVVDKEGKTDFKALAEIEKRFKQSPQLMSRWLTEGTKAAQEAAFGDIIETQTSTKEGEKKSERDLKQQATERAKQTTALERFKDIAKEGLAYSLASEDHVRDTLAAATQTVMNTGGILKWLQDIFMLLGRWSKDVKVEAFNKEKGQYGTLAKEYYSTKDQKTKNKLRGKMSEFENTWGDFSGDLSNIKEEARIQAEEKNLSTALLGIELNQLSTDFAKLREGDEGYADAKEKLEAKNKEVSDDARKRLVELTAATAALVKTQWEAAVASGAISGGNFEGLIKDMVSIASGGYYKGGIEWEEMAAKHNVQKETEFKLLQQTQDLIVTKGGDHLPYTFDKGDMIVKAESVGQGLRAPGGSLLENKGTNWTDVMDKNSKVNSDNMYNVGTVQMNFNKVAGEGELFEKDGPAAQLFYRLWYQLQKDKK